VWRSALLDGGCTTCVAALEREQQRVTQAKRLRAQFIELLGGEKPYREFTFERYNVTDINRAASERVQAFDPSRQNLYLHGPSRAGKTHLAVAAMRRWFGRGVSIALVTPAQLVRQLRMKPPEEEQQAIDRFVRIDLLVFDDLGSGGETPFGRQLLQEILDSRDRRDRFGLIVTSQHTIPRLAELWNERALCARLREMCQVVAVGARP
jgi:DNA replication protein DnaC